MPIDYSKGKIYKIECQETGRVYVGSTCQNYIADRLKGHVRDYRRYEKYGKKYVSSFDIIKTGNYKCLLLCNYPCNAKDELTAKEAEYIRQYKNDGTTECTNITIPCRTTKQYHEDNKEQIREHKKQHYETNKEQMREHMKQYYENNKEQIIEHKKQYREANKEQIREHKKQYYENNKEHAKQYYENNKERIQATYGCGCGGKYTHGTKQRHLRTKRHQAHEATQARNQPTAPPQIQQKINNK